MPDPRGRSGRTTYDGAGSQRTSARTHRRLARIGIGALHPACRAAAADNGNPCGRCSWLLGLDTEPARYVDAHLDDEVDV